MPDYLAMKWGTLKQWHFASDAAVLAYAKYRRLGQSFSAIDQKFTPVHKQALCALIDAVDGEIVDAWTNKPITKATAKRWVMEQPDDA